MKMGSLLVQLDDGDEGLLLAVPAQVTFRTSFPAPDDLSAVVLFDIGLGDHTFVGAVSAGSHGDVATIAKAGAVQESSSVLVAVRNEYSERQLFRVPRAIVVVNDTAVSVFALDEPAREINTAELAAVAPSVPAPPSRSQPKV